MSGICEMSEFTAAVGLILFLIIEHVVMVSIIFAYRAKFDTVSTVNEMVGELINTARGPVWPGSVWKRYDGQLFVSLGQAINEDSKAESFYPMIIYRRVFGLTEDQRVMSKYMFEGDVIVKDKVVPRFTFIPPEEISEELRKC